MDSDNGNPSHLITTANICNNENKKSGTEHSTDATLSEVCKQMSKLATDEVDVASDDSIDNEDVTGYNTIMSLAALKDILQGEDGTSTPETDNFFQHYFMNHCNNLSVRNSISPFPFPERRRLSQCREEDEDDEKKENDPPPSTHSSESCLEPSPSRTNTKEDVETENTPEALGAENNDANESESEPNKRTVMGVRHKFLVTTAKPTPSRLEKALLSQTHNAHTVHFGTKGAEETRPSAQSIFAANNLHRDKKYFDSSLVEIRSVTDDISTPPEDIWVKRIEQKANRVEKKNVVGEIQPKEKPRRVSLDGENVAERSRASSWSSRRDKEVMKRQSLERRSEDRRKHRDERLDAAITRSSQSVGERRRRGSADDGANHTMYQQTIHGTSGVSRRPALFDIFKSKRGESKRQPSFMKQVKTAVQNMGKSTTTVPKDVKEGTGSVTITPGKAKDGSAHLQAGSDSKYYHTVTGSTPRRTSGAIAKVMDIFRGRPAVGQSPSDAADRRKARAIAQHMQQNAAGANIRRAISQEAQRRRCSLGHLPAARHRASDALLDPTHAAILFRDSRGLPIVDPFLDKVTRSYLEEDESQIFVKFFKFHKCYDLIPTSAKLVVFDTKLLVKKAFFALVYNGVRAAPLWDSNQHRYIGMLTITDFIKILQMYYTSPDVAMDELEEHRLETWRRVLKKSVMPLVSIGPESSLFEAIRMLINNRIHRLPVIDPDTGNVIYILTHKRILRFLFLYINELPKPSYIKCKLRDLQIGTFHDIETASEDTLIIEALTKFVNRRVSALPIVDSDGRLKDIYAKFDVINLAAEKTYNNLDVTLKKANEHRNEWFEGVQKCTLDETLYDVMERIVKAEVHRLVVVDEEEKVTGIISLSDLLMYIVLRPTGEYGTDLRSDILKDSTEVEENAVSETVALETKVEGETETKGENDNIESSKQDEET